MVDFDIRLSIARQCRLLSISRSTYYYETKGESPFNQKLMRMIDEQFLKTPNYGSRKMARWLRRKGYCVGRKRVRRLMRLMGLVAIYPKPQNCPAIGDHLKKHPILVFTATKPFIYRKLRNVFSTIFYIHYAQLVLNCSSHCTSTTQAITSEFAGGNVARSPHIRK